MIWAGPLGGQARHRKPTASGLSGGDKGEPGRLGTRIARFGRDWWSPLDGRSTSGPGPAQAAHPADLAAARHRYRPFPKAQWPVRAKR